MIHFICWLCVQNFRTIVLRYLSVFQEECRNMAKFEIFEIFVFQFFSCVFLRIETSTEPGTMVGFSPSYSVSKTVISPFFISSTLFPIHSVGFLRKSVLKTDHRCIFCSGVRIQRMRIKIGTVTKKSVLFHVGIFIFALTHYFFQKTTNFIPPLHACLYHMEQMSTECVAEVVIGLACFALHTQLIHCLGVFRKFFRQICWMEW